MTKKEITKNLLSLKSLKENWDCYGAIRTKPLCIFNAINVINNKLISCDNFLDVHINQNGTISLHWRNSSNSMVGLEVGENDMSFYLLRTGLKVHEYHLSFNEENYTKLSSYIKQIENEEKDNALKAELSTYKQFIKYLDNEALGDTKSMISSFDMDGENIFHDYINVDKEIKDSNIILKFTFKNEIYEAKWLPEYNLAAVQLKPNGDGFFHILNLLPTHNEQKYFLIEYKREPCQILIM